MLWMVIESKPLPGDNKRQLEVEQQGWDAAQEGKPNRAESDPVSTWEYQRQQVLIMTCN
jgi:hypothetical protein